MLRLHPQKVDAYLHRSDVRARTPFRSLDQIINSRKQKSTGDTAAAEMLDETSGSGAGLDEAEVDDRLMVDSFTSLMEREPVLEGTAHRNPEPSSTANVQSVDEIVKCMNNFGGPNVPMSFSQLCVFMCIFVGRAAPILEASGIKLKEGKNPIVRLSKSHKDEA